MKKLNKLSLVAGLVVLTLFAGCQQMAESKLQKPIAASSLEKSGATKDVTDYKELGLVFASIMADPALGVIGDLDFIDSDDSRKAIKFEELEGVVEKIEKQLEDFFDDLDEHGSAGININEYYTKVTDFVIDGKPVSGIEITDLGLKLKGDVRASDEDIRLKNGFTASLTGAISAKPNEMISGLDSGIKEIIGSVCASAKTKDGLCIGMAYDISSGMKYLYRGDVKSNVTVNFGFSYASKLGYGGKFIVTLSSDININEEWDKEIESIADVLKLKVSIKAYNDSNKETYSKEMTSEEIEDIIGEFLPF